MSRTTPLVIVLALVIAGPQLQGQIAAAPLTAKNGMVVGPEPLATDVALQVLRDGGNGVDAAVALGFALAVTFPSAGNLGGGGFMVIQAPGGELVALDYREMAPLAATREMYLDAAGRAIPEKSTVGHLAVGVPGSVAGMCHAHARFGKLPLKSVMAGAIRLAEDGFPVSRFLARSLRGNRVLLASHEESRRIFLAGGKGHEEGETFVQSELAATLKRIAESGPEGFYSGVTADLMLAEMQRGGGILKKADLVGYRVMEREPLVGRYRGHEIVSMPPPSSGGVALLQMLQILEGFPISEWGFGAEDSVHTMAEAMRFAFRDRALHLGDPDFSPIPVEDLVRRPYCEALRKQIGARAAVSEGLINVPFEKDQTTHYSILDASGFAVACTTTLNGSYGCGVTVKGAGFLLNNEMDDFAVAPGVPNMFDLIQGEANAVGPRKRPLSSMTPTLVRKDGKVVMVIGSPGGPTIITTVLQCILNVVDHGMTISQAIAAPRFHHQWKPDRIVHEPFGLNPDVIRGLKQRGHELVPRDGYQGDAHGIWVDLSRGLLTGAADPRYGGAARGF
ncbi:MAG TPA: gamma-glutamyltransferase [Planctomycetota bacterium]|jgi:gamma-glutamyltranspeptidase/glutathione hydrolase|nr:gamma-glutamyltransferase [Planctomycetota bacterium]